MKIKYIYKVFTFLINEGSFSIIYKEEFNIKLNGETDYKDLIILMKS